MDDSSGDPAAGFTNPPIVTDRLPTLGDHEFAPLDPAYQRMRTAIAVTVAAVVVAIAAAIAAATASWIPVIAGAGALGVVGLVAVVQRIEAEHMGYLIRQHDLSFRSGVVSRSVATAPFARVQHVSIGRGPIERRFGLATLQLRTAGGHIAVAGLPVDVAERLKELVAERAATLAEAEAEADRGDPAVS